MTSVDIDYYRAFDDNDDCGITEREVLGRGRDLQQFDDSTVALAETRVRQSGILEQLDRWAAEDAKRDGMGGRPAMISYRALLTALLLLAQEGPRSTSGVPRTFFSTGSPRSPATSSTCPRRPRALLPMSPQRSAGTRTRFARSTE